MDDQIQTLPLQDIWDVWIDKLVNSMAINQFCDEHFGKLPLIFLGYDFSADPPTAEDCPFIALAPGEKIEGDDEENFLYKIPISLGIYNDEKPDTSIDRVIKYKGVIERDQFVQLVIAEIHDAGNWPIARIEVDTFDYYNVPQWIASLAPVIRIPYIIGVTPTY